MTQTDDIRMVVTHDRQERQPITLVWQKWRFSATDATVSINPKLPTSPSPKTLQAI